MQKLISFQPDANLVAIAQENIVKITLEKQEKIIDPLFQEFERFLNWQSVDTFGLSDLRGEEYQTKKLEAFDKWCRDTNRVKTNSNLQGDIYFILEITTHSENLSFLVSPEIFPALVGELENVTNRFLILKYTWQA